MASYSFNSTLIPALSMPSLTGKPNNFLGFAVFTTTDRIWVCGGIQKVSSSTQQASDECLYWTFGDDTWVNDAGAAMLEARAYIQDVQLSDGRVWVGGGAKQSVFGSSEYGMFRATDTKCVLNLFTVGFVTKHRDVQNAEKVKQCRPREKASKNN